MSNEKKSKELIGVHVNVEAVYAAARNSDKVDNIALEIETINPLKINLEQSIYTLKSVPANDKAKGKLKEFSPKVVGIICTEVESLKNNKSEGVVTINGTIDIPRSGRKTVTLEECVFDNEQDAKAVARVVTEVELERAQELVDDFQSGIDFLKKQVENDRF